MAVKIVFNSAGFKALEKLAQQSLGDRARAIADACNAESSWGGYESDVSHDGRTAQVWSADGPHNDESRSQRLLKNVDAGA